MTTADDMVKALESELRSMPNFTGSYPDRPLIFLDEAVTVVRETINSRTRSEPKWGKTELTQVIEAMENGCHDCESEDDGTFESCEKHKSMWELADAILTSEPPENRFACGDSVTYGGVPARVEAVTFRVDWSSPRYEIVVPSDENQRHYDVPVDRLEKEGQK